MKLWCGLYSIIYLAYFCVSDDYTFQVLNPGMFSVTLNSEEVVDGELIFIPTEVSQLSFIWKSYYWKQRTDDKWQLNSLFPQKKCVCVNTKGWLCYLLLLLMSVNN